MRKPIVSVEVEQGQIFVNTVNVFVQNKYLLMIAIDCRAKRFQAGVHPCGEVYLYAESNTLRAEATKELTVVRLKVNKPGKWIPIEGDVGGKNSVVVWLYRRSRRNSRYTQVWSSQ